MLNDVEVDATIDTVGSSAAWAPVGTGGVTTSPAPASVGTPPTRLGPPDPGVLKRQRPGPDPALLTRHPRTGCPPAQPGSSIIHSGCRSPPTTRGWSPTTAVMIGGRVQRNVAGVAYAPA